jgi:hypothetical protein
MPNIRKVPDAERDAIVNSSKSSRKKVEEEYDTILREFDVGDVVIAELSDADKRATIRNRLKAAAERRGMGITFQRVRNGTIQFRLLEPRQSLGAHRRSNNGHENAGSLK